MQRRKLPGRSRKSFPYGASFQTRHICVKGNASCCRAATAAETLVDQSFSKRVVGRHSGALAQRNALFPVTFTEALPVDVMRFFPSERFAEQASAAYAEHSRRIRKRLPDADVRHVGGTSVPGVLTTGDVDLHVRVEADAFAAARYYEGRSADEYAAAKREFFRRNFRL
jgi:GrpB protein